jgi:hypothetical protein
MTLNARPPGPIGGVRGRHHIARGGGQLVPPWQPHAIKINKTTKAVAMMVGPRESTRSPRLVLSRRCFSFPTMTSYAPMGQPLTCRRRFQEQDAFANLAATVGGPEYELFCGAKLTHQ